ncbi:MAG: hypothetical protein NVSMB43_23770 [Pseudarthrobacter sp.]
MILVAGGTGRLGRALVPLLVDAGHQVRVMARGNSQPFPGAAADGVELLRGDLASDEDCRKAVAGCTAAVFAASGFGIKNSDPRTVDRDGAVRLVQAAAAAGVEHVVMMSMHGASADGPIEFLRCKAAAEDAVRSSGMAWTIIRIGVLLEQRLEIMTGPFESKGKVMVFGSGQAPVTYTSVKDAAALVVRAVSDPALRNRVIEWGSATASANEVAEAVLARAGHGSVQRIPCGGRAGPIRCGKAVLPLPGPDRKGRDVGGIRRHGLPVGPVPCGVPRHPRHRVAGGPHNLTSA